MKKLIIIFLSFVLFSSLNSCLYNNNKNKNKFVDTCIDYELEVYISILDSIVFMRGYGPFPPPPPLSLKEKRKYEFEMEEFNSIIDTVAKYVFISDTLYMIDDLIKWGNKLGYFNQIVNCSNIIEQLCDSINKYTFIPINTNSIIDYFAFYDKFEFQEDGLYMGLLSLSKVLFNDDYTKGCLFHSFVCGSKCARTLLIIVEKNGDKWEIKEEIFLSGS